ncbi:hypothetical protein HME9304_03375 [Flagellimonas maritima]|uniref:Uncharacterized protein n=1 Tax=Flagellimonas maritima TaxID=1383885 RepID=A0A2Z4LWZ1_9FLAO|nr:hypothetical protein [Allomuricauda aurantiaca]AWX46342.1 hypothetical protein HME9304_03375 [Allomuricauda aurantiaca]
MKKTLSIFAIALMTIGMFSCEAENDVQETESLFETLDVSADGSPQPVDGDDSNDDDRGN